MLIANSKDSTIPTEFLRTHPPVLPELSEQQMVDRYLPLSQQSTPNKSYLLNSDAIRYQPPVCQYLASLSGFSQRHPQSPIGHSQGVLSCLFELQNSLQQISGMERVSLAPTDGQGQFASLAVIKAYHQANQDSRSEILVPDGMSIPTEMSGYQIKKIALTEKGNLDIKALQLAISDKTAGMILSNPRLGVFEHQIQTIAEIVHQAGGLLCYHGDNLNAILGQVRVNEMGFDLMHFNLHNTFASPYGAEPIGVSSRLVPFLPIPMVAYNGDKYQLLTETDCPQSIGYLNGFLGNIEALLNAYVYIQLLGRDGLKRVSEFSILNANYLKTILMARRLKATYPAQHATNQCLINLKKQKKDKILAAITPLFKYGLIPSALPDRILIEPTETATKQNLDEFGRLIGEALEKIE
jgi:glycine dehydrogenase subunit 2